MSLAASRVRNIGRQFPRLLFLLGLGLSMTASLLQGQSVVSVPFSRGFFGTQASADGTSNSVTTFASLGISRVLFSQTSATSEFEEQGNDIPGTLTIVRSNGSVIEMPASVNWRNNGGTSFLIGILPRPTSPVTITNGAVSFTITTGGTSGGTSIGGYFNSYGGPYLTDGASISGNAARTQALAALNAYLAVQNTNRPIGPVTVNAVSTADDTPRITGTVTLGAGESLTVTVNGVQYSTSTSPALVISGSTWSLTLTSALAAGTYNVTATITDADGYTLTDTSTGELVIRGGALTVGGSFTANNKVYDGTTAATGTTGTLTLVGVGASDTVSIASVTLAFASSVVGTGKTVSITAITLTGPQASLYTVNLAGPPAAPTATAAITPKTLTLTGGFTAANKVFDGTTAATITSNTLTLVGVIGSDVVTLTSPVAAFANATVGTGKLVSLTSGTLDGAAAGNYTLDVSGRTTTANITSAGGTLTVGGSFTAYDKVYDGMTAATGTTGTLTLVGIAAGDTVSIASVTLAFASSAVGTGKTVSITAITLTGPQASLYTVNLAGPPAAPTATAAITPKTLTLTGGFTAANKVYDGNTTAIAPANTLSLVGLVGGDVVTLTSPIVAFATASVGTGKVVSLTGGTLVGALSGNYTLSLVGAPTTTANITPRPLEIVGRFAVFDKIFDGGTAATISESSLSLSGVIGSDIVLLSELSAVFESATVGTGKLVLLLGGVLSGANASNYALDPLGERPTSTGTILAATPPSAPQRVSASVVDGRIRLTWALPEDEGCLAVTGYVVAVSIDDGRTWRERRVNDRAAVELALDALEMNVNHRVRIAAVNECGTSDWALVSSPVIPVSPVLGGGGGRPAPINSAITPSTRDTLRVTSDTTLVVTSGALGLALSAADVRGGALPVDASGTMLLEQGGQVQSLGLGFAASTYASMYLFGPTGAPILLSVVPVKSDGTFDLSGRLAADLPPGRYVIQVNGRDALGILRSISLEVEVAEPPPELTLVVTPSTTEPAVGDTITLTLTVTNTGSGTAIDVEIPRAFDERGFQLIRAMPEQGTFDAARRVWSISRIAAGNQARLVLTVVVLHTIVDGESAR